MTTSQQLNAALINAIAAKVTASTATPEEIAIYTKGLQLLQSGTDFEAVTAGLADQSVQAIDAAKAALVAQGDSAMAALLAAQTASVAAIDTATGAMQSSIATTDTKLDTLLISLHEAWGYSTGKAMIALTPNYYSGQTPHWYATLPLYDKTTNRLYSALRKPTDANNSTTSEVTLRHTVAGVQTNLRTFPESFAEDGFAIQYLLPLARSENDASTKITYVCSHSRDGATWYRMASLYTISEINWAGTNYSAAANLPHSDSFSGGRVKYDRINKTIVYLGTDNTLANAAGKVRELFADGSSRQVAGGLVAAAGYDTYTSDITRFVLLPTWWNTDPDYSLWGHATSSSTQHSLGFAANDNLVLTASPSGKDVAHCPQWVLEPDGVLRLYKTCFTPIYDTWAGDKGTTGSMRSVGSMRGYRFTVLDHQSNALRYGAVYNPLAQQNPSVMASDTGGQYVWLAALPYGYHLADDYLQSIYTKKEIYAGSAWQTRLSVLDVTRLTQ